MWMELGAALTNMQPKSHSFIVCCADFFLWLPPPPILHCALHFVCDATVLQAGIGRQGAVVFLHLPKHSLLFSKPRNLSGMDPTGRRSEGEFRQRAWPLQACGSPTCTIPSQWLKAIVSFCFFYSMMMRNNQKTALPK